jgi:ABC-type uncharacterized transport system substrate-binding protein
VVTETATSAANPDISHVTALKPVVVAAVDVVTRHLASTFFGAKNLPVFLTI